MADTRLLVMPIASRVASRPRRCLAGFAAIAVLAIATGCGRHGHPLLTTADVRGAFASLGLHLNVGRDKAPRIHFMWYTVDGTVAGERLAVFVFDEPAGATYARIYAKQAAKAGNVSEALVARNVV